MKPSELRIGNWVDVSGEIQVSLLDLSNIYNWKERYKGYAACPYKPIPLTDEWLVKFGFKKTKYGYWEGKEYFELAERKNGTYINSVNCNEYNHGMEIKYVHQLQNLYFALTGEELTINK